MEWLLNAGLPYKIIEKDRFKIVVDSINPRFTIPSSKTLREAFMPKIYLKTKSYLKRLIKDRLVYAITTDLWSSSFMDAYMAFSNPMLPIVLV